MALREQGEGRQGIGRVGENPRLGALLDLRPSGICSCEGRTEERMHLCTLGFGSLPEGTRLHPGLPRGRGSGSMCTGLTLLRVAHVAQAEHGKRSPSEKHAGHTGPLGGGRCPCAASPQSTLGQQELPERASLPCSWFQTMPR